MDLIHSVRKMLNDIETFHDSFTKSHECRTGRLMSILGNAIGLDSEFCASLGEAGSIHDIGKLAIPANILEKSGPLSVFERKTVELHSEIGHKMIKHLNHPLGKLASVIALTHHEGYDGSGYPQGLKGEEIPLEGRICSVCDIYDALRSYRPYRPNQTHESVIQLMQTTGSEGIARKLDPALLEAFVSVSEEIDSIYQAKK
jgi:putative two-component system response regulator